MLHSIAIPPGMETRFFVQCAGALAELPELLNTAFPEKKPFLVADENTWRAAGEQAEQILVRAGFTVELKIFSAQGKLHPDSAISERLAQEFPAGCVPVAVGSGVINDLVKHASGVAGIPYCCVPTAPSVDGYTSSGGAMQVNGFKMTLPCPAPLAVLSDLEVLRNAPKDMLSGGYADLATKIPAGADWYIADLLGEEKIVPAVWDLVQTPLRDYLSDPQDMGRVFAGLAATGYAMQLYNGSRPASGFEHLCSHVWEMEHLLFQGEEPSHGYKVGIGSLITIVLMEFVLSHTAAEAAALATAPVSVEERQREIAELLVRGCYGDNVETVAMAKFRTGSALEARRQEIWRLWPVMQEKIRSQIPGLEEFKLMLTRAGCPVHPQEIGLTREQLNHGVRTAQLIRNRYTVADLLYEAGLLELAMQDLEKLWQK